MTKTFAWGLVACAVVALGASQVGMAGIPIPVSGVQKVASDAQGGVTTLSNLLPGAAQGVAADAQSGASEVVNGLGVAPGGNGGDPNVVVPFDAVAQASADAQAGAASSAAAALGASTASGKDASAAGQLVTSGSTDTANSGIASAQAIGFGTESSFNGVYDLVDPSVESFAGSAGGLQGVFTQGTLNTYNAHAAPAACVLAGIVGDLSGAFSAQDACDGVLLA